MRCSKYLAKFTAELVPYKFGNCLLGSILSRRVTSFCINRNQSITRYLEKQLRNVFLLIICMKQ